MEVHSTHSFVLSWVAPGEEGFWALPSSLPNNKNDDDDDDDDGDDDDDDTNNCNVNTLIVVRHGSSLALVAAADVMLRQEFRLPHPEQEFVTWQALGVRPYYLAVQQTTMSGDRDDDHDDDRDDDASGMKILSCMRCLLDGDFDSLNTKNDNDDDDDDDNDDDDGYCHRRVVIDFLFTLPRYQNRGFARHLLYLVQNTAEHYQANVYVVAHEDAAVYWMEKGFVLQNPPDSPMHGKFGDYDDSFLLKLPTNRPEHPNLIVPAEDDYSGSNDEDEDWEQEETDASRDDNGSSSSGSSSSSSDGDEDDDDERNLQRAIMESLQME